MRASSSATQGTFLTTMCTLPSTRKNAPPRKYFATLRSCAASSSSEYGSSRSGGFLPGRKRNSAATTTAKNDAKVRNWSVERCLRYTPALGLAEPRLQEVDRQRPAEVEERDDREDDPGARDGSTRVARLLLTCIPVPDERPGRAMPLFRLGRHQKIFSSRRVDSASMPAVSRSIRTSV